jgi:hypothetical protein
MHAFTNVSELGSISTVTLFQRCWQQLERQHCDQHWVANVTCVRSSRKANKHHSPSSGRATTDAASQTWSDRPCITTSTPSLLHACQDMEDIYRLYCRSGFSATCQGNAEDSLRHTRHIMVASTSLQPMLHTTACTAAHRHGASAGNPPIGWCINWLRQVASLGTLHSMQVC